MIFFKLRDAVDKGRGHVDQVFTLRLIIEKSICCQTPLVPSFIDYEQAFDSVDRRALAKVILIWCTRKLH